MIVKEEMTTSEKVVMIFAVPVAILAAIGCAFVFWLIANILAGDLLPFADQLSILCFDATNVAEELVCDIAS